jgi:uncharacterized repeat protein (TIGR01451 family)
LPLAALSLLLLLASAASAQTNIYQIRGTASFNIYTYNVSTNTETLVYASYPGGSSATLAQRPSDGMLFYVINATNGQVYRFNPATPSVAPVALGTLGAGIAASFRMAFSPSGTLYYMPDSGVLYTINQTTGVATSTGATVTGLGSGGDMAFSSAGTLYVINSARQLLTAPLAGGAATSLGTVTFPGGITPATLGLAFDLNGRLLVQTQNPNNIYSVSLATLQATFVSAGDGDTTATGDLGSANVPAPELSVTKTDGVSTVYRGGSVSYTVVVTNNGTYAVTGTVTDTVPASVTGVAWTCAASSGSSCAAASGSGNSLSTSATLAAAGTATYTVTGTVSAAATGTLVNTATVAVPSWLTDSNTSNNTATDTDTINLNANLGITKTDGLTSVNPGATVTYTIVASNAGPDAATGASVTDTVPAVLGSVTWTCGSPTGGATCGAASGSGNTISTTANLPSGGSVTYTVTGTLATNATGTLSNTAQVAAPSGVTDPTAGNNSATDTTAINLVPDPGITKSHAGNFTRGSTGSYTLTISNSGTGATSGAVNVTDTLPAGLTPNGTPTGTGWTCSVAGQTITCTRSDALAAGASYPAITVPVNVLQTAANSLTNTASVSGGGGNISTSNDSASDVTTAVSSADLSLTKTASDAAPTVNQNVTFTLTLSNAGPTNASGVAVTDGLPAGLAYVSSTPSAGTSFNSGTGVWTVGAVASGANATLQIVAKVTASGTITNTAQVTAANEPDPDSTPNNNNAAEDDQASAALTVAAPPTITLCKTFPGQTCVPPPSLPAQQPGADVTFVIIFTNGGGSAAQGLVIADGVPANTDFKVGSVVSNLATTGLAVSVQYSNNNGTTYAYTPSSGGGGAPAGYDRSVTHVRWTFTGSLSQTPPANTGDVRFTTRIR